MKDWQANVVTLYGDQGRAWLQNIQSVINQLSIDWNLFNINPINHSGYHFVAQASQNDKSVVLKIGYDQAVVLQEISALKHFNGSHCVALIDHKINLGALLIESINPGITLKKMHTQNLIETFQAYSEIVRGLPKKIDPMFAHISDWLKILDSFLTDVIPNEWIQKAKKIKEKLLSSMNNSYVTHGDLHLNNILKSHDSWVAIDPKGVIAEESFECAAFDFISEDEFDYVTSQILLTRMAQLSKVANIDYVRLKAWVYLRLILAIIWSIEDGTDFHRFHKLAHLLYDSIGTKL